VQPPPRIALFPGSRRADSLNVALAHEVAKALAAYGAAPVVVHLGDFDMPMYDGDCEEAVGVPEAVVRPETTLISANNSPGSLLRLCLLLQVSLPPEQIPGAAAGRRWTSTRE